MPVENKFILLAFFMDHIKLFFLSNWYSTTKRLFNR